MQAKECTAYTAVGRLRMKMNSEGNAYGHVKTHQLTANHSCDNILSKNDALGGKDEKNQYQVCDMVCSVVYFPQWSAYVALPVAARIFDFAI